MIPSADIGSLARAMASRSTGSKLPYVLFLGQGCARAAGVPSTAQLAHSIFADLWDKDPDFAASYLKAEDREHEDRLIAAFYAMFSRMSGLERYSVLQTYYGAIPVPSCYLDLARLIKAGYFTTILTTNIDTLLDQALNGVGLWPDTAYHVIMPGEDMRRDLALAEVSVASAPGDAAIRLIKLHGDMTQGVVSLTPDEIEATLWPRRRQVKGALTGDIVVVGYEFESEPINHLLLRSPAHELWWVSPDPPVQSLLIDASRMIIGESGSPSEFFSQLSLRLLRASAPNFTKQAALDRPPSGVEAVGGTRSVPRSGAPDNDNSEVYPEAALGSSDGDDYSEAAYLQDRIRRYQLELSSQELAALRGEVNAQREAQIRYLREQIARSEDEFREAERRNTPFGTQPRLLELLDRLSASAWRPGDAHVQQYVLSQIAVVKSEYAGPQPSQDTLSAALGAICLLAERLSPDVVSPQLVRALVVYAPSIGRKGV